MNSRLMNSRLLLLGFIVIAAGALWAAAVVDPFTQPPTTLGAYVFSTTDLEGVGGKAYRPYFENAGWQGDIVEYDVTEFGSATTDVEVGAYPPVAAGSNWSARVSFVTQERQIANYWKTERRIISYNGDDQVAFTWTGLTADQKALLDGNTDASLTDPYASPILNHLRGDRSNEVPAAGNLRFRFNLLGDIQRSAPIYVGPPTANFNLPGYPAFKDGQRSRAARIVVGANDGMVHFFRTEDEASNPAGSEVYAYVPSMLMDKLKLLTDDRYGHSYFVDGELSYSDAFFDSAWHSVVVGGLGAGAKGLYLLDVTDPYLLDETAKSGTDLKVLAEFSADGDHDMGYIHSRPRIAPLEDGNWYIITGNGVGSVNGVGYLYLIDLSNFAVVKVLACGSGAIGLSGPSLIDTDGNGLVDRVYALDLSGKICKFELSGSTGNSSSELFNAGINQPFTGSSDVARHPNGGYLVYGASGSLLSGNDAGDTNAQSIYGIWDKVGGGTVEYKQLEPQTLATDSFGSRSVLKVSNTTIPDWSTQRGWRVDFLNSGERVLGKLQVRGQRLQFVTANPTIEFGESWLMQLDYLSGGDGGHVIFDLNNDGFLNADDTLTGDLNPIGLYLGKGLFSQPSFARISTGIDVLLINGFIPPPPPPPCEGDCEGGIEGGHIDVDTDTTLGGDTDTHEHEYDDKFDTTIIDYPTLQGGGKDDKPRVTDHVGIDERFYIVLANADLSTGGTLTIGAEEFKVRDYQDEIIEQLKAGTAPTYTLAGLGITTDPSTGTISITFNSKAIIDGGLIGTNTGCVRDRDPEDPANLGRWRNGALTLHLIDAADMTSYQIQTENEGSGAHATSGLLYESTLFWHWNSGSMWELRGNGNPPCYGDEDWEAAAASQLIPLTDEEIAALEA